MLSPIRGTQCLYLGICRRRRTDGQTPQGHSPSPGTKLLRSRARASATASSCILATCPDLSRGGSFITNPHRGFHRLGNATGWGKKLPCSSTSLASLPPIACGPHQKRHKPPSSPPKTSCLPLVSWWRNAGDPPQLCSPSCEGGLAPLSTPPSPGTPQEGMQVTVMENCHFYWTR